MQTVWVVYRVQGECDTCCSGGGVEGVFSTEEQANVLVGQLKKNRYCGLVYYDISQQVINQTGR
ncbi:MAG: DUF7336 domain-containing protein [bacterium]